LLAQLEAVRDAGGDAVGISAPGPDVAFLESRGIRHRPLTASTRSMNPLADLRAARQLWRILREERPDVLHTHNPKPGLYGRVLGRIAGVPRVVHTTHGLYATPDDSIAKRAVVYSLESIASRFSHVEFSQNREDYELMRRWRIAPRRKLRLLGNGVDIERFSPTTQPELRRELGFTDDEIVVGCVARLVAEKGVPELVEAVAALGSPFRLLLVGDHDPQKADSLSSEWMQRARDRGVVITGWRDDVDRVYGAMDVFCLVSHREGFPRGGMEAAASGLPLVVTDIRGCREVVAHEINGLLVPVRDSSAITAALQRLADPEVRAAFGVASRAQAVDRFDERDVVARVMASYVEGV
jgi:glycosyltransferase involved in cell wall biosynthesis